MAGCSFADNFVNETTVEANGGVFTFGAEVDHGFTPDAVAGYITYDIIPQPGGFSAKARFKATRITGSRNPIINNGEIGVSGFWIYLKDDYVYAQHGNGAEPHTACIVTADILDGEVHAITYVVDMTNGVHTLRVDALDAVQEATAINEVIGNAQALKICSQGAARYEGTVYKPRILDSILTQADHDAYHADTLISFGKNPFAVYPCNEICDDTAGDKIWERGLNDRDLYKADRVAGAKYPTFSATPTPRYTFDGADDYVSNVPDLPSTYTTTAALESVGTPRPWIQQDNDAAFLDDISTEGDYTGILHSLSIHEGALSSLQLLQDEYQHLYWLDRQLAWGLYHRLITEETCQLLMFPGSHATDFTDYSRNLHPGTPTNVTNLGPNGCIFPQADSRITVANTTGIGSEPFKSVQGTLVFYGRFFTSEVPGMLADKGTGLEFRTDGNNLDFMGSTIAHTFDDNTQIAVVWKKGYKPRFFVDGFLIGEGNAIVNPSDAGSDDLIIGNNNAADNPTPYALNQVYFGTDPLTDDEIYAMWSDRRSIDYTPIPTFRAFSQPSGVGNLNPNLAINGVTKTPALRYKLGDADAVGLPPWTYGVALEPQGSGGTYNTGSPCLGSNDDSYDVEGTRWYDSGVDTTAGDITTEDIVVELLFRAGSDGGNAPIVLNKRFGGSGNGWRLDLRTVENLSLLLDSGGQAQVITNSLTIGCWYHAIIFVNRDEASANGAQWYLNGVADGAGVNMSAIAGSITNNVELQLGGELGGNIYLSKIAYIAMWKQAAWMQAGAAGPAEWATIAAERFAKFSGMYPQQAVGTALASVKTRAYPAYLDKMESGVSKLYHVGAEWLRMCSRDDSGAENVQGYLPEPQVENLIDECEDFSAWTKLDAGDTVTDDAAVCPDGRTAAASLVADSTSGGHGVKRNTAALTADTYTFSIFARPGDFDWIFFWNNTIANCHCYFDIANGAVGTPGAAITGYIEGPFFGDYFRCCIVFTGTVGAHDLRIYSAVADGDATIAGDGGTVNTYLWGAQCEKNDYMSSLVYTNGATAIRLKDQLRFVGDDGNVTNNRRGTLAMDVLYSDYDNVDLRYFWSINDGGGAADRINAVMANDLYSAATRATVGNIGTSNPAGDVADGAIHQLRCQWAIDDFVASRDGVDGATDTDCGVPNDLDQVDIGTSRVQTAQAQCLIQNLRIFSEPTTED